MATQSVITAVIHELLNREVFRTSVDLTETVKDRCAKLHIPYDGGRISDAIRVVERTRPVLHAPARGSRAAGHQAVQRGPDPHGSLPVSKADARRILAGLGIRL